MPDVPYYVWYIGKAINTIPYADMLSTGMQPDYFMIRSNRDYGQRLAAVQPRPNVMEWNHGNAIRRGDIKTIRGIAFTIIFP